MRRRQPWWPSPLQLALMLAGVGLAAPSILDRFEYADRQALPLTLAAICLVLAVLWCGRSRRQWRTEQRRRTVACTACGYDLHESVTCCTECGARLPIDHRTLSETVASLERM